MDVLDQPVLPPFILGNLLQVARDRGLRHAHWFRALPLPLDRLQDAAARVSYRQSVAVIKQAVGEHPDLPLGLEVGAWAPQTASGVFGFGLSSSRDLAQALEFGLEHHIAAGSLVDAAFLPQGPGGHARLVLTKRAREPVVGRFLYEEALASTCLVFRPLLRSGFIPRRILLPYAAPPYAAAYARMFRCAVEFDADYCAIEFPLADLSAPLATANPASFELARQACRELLEEIAPPTDLAAQIRQLIRVHIPRRVGSGEIAQLLGCSDRTLRRRLTDAGLSYQALRDAEWAACSQRLLGQAGSTVAGVAQRMGFQDPRDFRRAFKRWTGQSPRSV